METKAAFYGDRGTAFHGILCLESAGCMNCHLVIVQIPVSDDDKHPALVPLANGFGAKSAVYVCQPPSELLRTRPRRKTFDNDESARNNDSVLNLIVDPDTGVQDIVCK